MCVSSLLIFFFLSLLSKFPRSRSYISITSEGIREPASRPSTGPGLPSSTDMGNCLALLREAEKAKKLTIKIMTVDGKILEHRSPLKVHEALSEFPGHAISESLPVVRHLDPDADMQGGNLYYLLPPKKGVQATEAKSEEGTSMVRIKLVVSKQELQEMLSKGGVVSLGEMISLLQGRSAAAGGGGDSAGRRSWKPILESIPEASDLCAS